MSTMDKDKPSLEEFKAELLNWKNEHINEYNRFAEQMNGLEEDSYIGMFHLLGKTVPKLSKMWKNQWNSDSKADFNQMFITVTQSALPDKLLENYNVAKGVSVLETPLKGIQKLLAKIGLGPKPKIQISAPLLLCWLFYGQSFESVVEMLDKQAGRGLTSKIQRRICGWTVKSAISTSLKYNYRSTQDWEEYLLTDEGSRLSPAIRYHIEEALKIEVAPSEAQEPESVEEVDKTLPPSGRSKARTLPLREYLNCDNADAVLDVIRKFIIAQNTGKGLALPYFALRELEIINSDVNDKEYAIGLRKQFSNINLKSESTIRQGVGEMENEEEFVVIDDKTIKVKLKESDKYAPLLENLKNEIKATLGSSSS